MPLDLDTLMHQFPALKQKIDRMWEHLGLDKEAAPTQPPPEAQPAVPAPAEEDEEEVEEHDPELGHSVKRRRRR